MHDNSHTNLFISNSVGYNELALKAESIIVLKSPNPGSAISTEI